MKEEQMNAFNVVAQVCGEFQGRLEDHQKIQHALMVIKESIDPQEGDIVEPREIKNEEE